MFGSYGRTQRFLSGLTLTLVLALLSATADAQSAKVPPGTANVSSSGAVPGGVTKVETTVEAASAEPISGPADAQAPAKNEGAVEPSNAETDAAKVETVPADAAVATPAAPPSASPSVSPSPSPSPNTSAPAPPVAPPCKRTIEADVVALAQPYMLNRLGASMPNALIYALRNDILGNNASNAQLQPWKRARPIVLRANEGDCLKITLTNLINSGAFGDFPPSTTPPVSLHVQGMQLVNSMSDDGSFVGANTSSLVAPTQSKVYTLFAEHEGTFLLYSEGDTNTTGQQLFQGLFGALNVQPEGAEWYRSQVTQDDLRLATDRTKGNNGLTALGQPIIKYDALYPGDYKDKSRACTPILKMVDVKYKVAPDGRTCQKDNDELKIYHSDLTAIITGPSAGRFPGDNGVGGPTAVPLLTTRTTTPSRSAILPQPRLARPETALPRGHGHLPRGDNVGAQAFPFLRSNAAHGRDGRGRAG